MQNIEQEVERHYHHGSWIKEIERAQEKIAARYWSRKIPSLTPATSQDFRQHTADHHTDHAKANKSVAKWVLCPITRVT